MTAAAALNLVGATVPAFDDPAATVPAAGNASAGTPVPAGAVSPREYFHNGNVADLPRFESLVGPLSPTPNLTLADAISRAVAADERWYALNDGWVA